MKCSGYLMAGGALLLLTQLGFAERAVAEVPDLADGLLSFESAAVSEIELADQRGRKGSTLQFQISDPNQNALLEDNLLLGSVTGGNLIDRGAFSSANGFTTVIQNSGNQVIIQESTLINVFINQ